MLCSAMVHGAKDTRGGQTNQTMLVLFVEFFSTTEVSVFSLARSFDMKDFLRCVNSCTVAPTRATVAVLTEMTQARTYKQFTTGIAVNEAGLFR